MKKIILTTFLFLAVGTACLYAQTGIESVVSTATTSVKNIGKNIAIILVIIGGLAATALLFWKFEDNKVVKNVLVGLCVGCLILGAISGLITFINSATW